MTQDYLQSIRKYLSDFSPEEQEAFLEEIRSHIESGEEDPKMGANPEQRRKTLMAELGSPNDLGRNFRTIYRQSGFIDFLWIVIPYLLYPFLNMIYVKLMPTYPWADVRLDILIHIPLILIGLWRRSAPLALFWLTTIVTQIIAMLLLVQGYYGAFQSVIWSMVALGLLLLLAYIVWQNRQDSLITTFGLLPIIMCAIGTILAIIHPNAVTYTTGPIDRLLLDIYADAAGFGGGYLPFYGTLLTMALFFLVMDRSVRWFALGLYGLVIALSRHYLNIFDYDQGLMHPLVYSFYVILPLVILLLGGMFNQSRAKSQITE